MNRTPRGSQWKTLDTDLNRISQVELATTHVARPLVAPGLALAFMLVAGLVAAVFFGQSPGSFLVVAAAAVGAYMAVNIGANDVANNMGPAVGANVLSMGSAIAIAAICESAGALLAGGDVVNTISREIIDPAAVADARVFVWAMLAALISSALWVNLATWIGAPVSTTHSVVGGVMGAGVAAAGIAAVNWTSMGLIATSWVVSPVIGGALAALFLAFLKARILYREDKLAAARRWVPILLGGMGGVFAAYLAFKGLARIIRLGLPEALAIGLVSGLLCWAVTAPMIARSAAGLENRNKSVKLLFGLPLVCSAGLLSFAHGANDVANAVGPLAAIVSATQSVSFPLGMPTPAWVMVIGAFGISFGLFLFGPKLVRLVGNKIAKLNPLRASCVALATAVTVLLASWLGLPVSSTHIAVGGVFGVGFYREWHMERRLRRAGKRPGKVKTIAAEERRRRRLVRRSHFMTVIAAWVVTVPAAAALSALVFLSLHGLLR